MIIPPTAINHHLYHSNKKQRRSTIKPLGTIDSPFAETLTKAIARNEKKESN